MEAIVMDVWATDEWVEPWRSPRHLNRGALRHFVRVIERERQMVGVPVITLPAGWTLEMISLVTCVPSDLLATLRP